jgi:hypothetical protein
MQTKTMDRDERSSRHVVHVVGWTGSVEEVPMRFLFSLVVGPVGLLCAGCGGNAVAGGEPQPGPGDSGLPESGLDASTEEPPMVGPDASQAETISFDVSADVPPGEFCSGEAKIQVGGPSTVFLSPPLTTSPVIMDCCDGIVVRFHLKQPLGYNISITVRGGGNLAKGAYVLGDEPGGIEVTARKEGAFGEWLPATGTLHVDTEYPEPRQVGFCLETLGGDTLPALRMYVPQVLAAPYDWDNRWSIYLLSNPSVSATDALKQPIDSLSLDSQPIVHLMSIAYYGQGANTAIWDDWYTSEALLNSLPQVGVYGLPFVVVAGGEKIYVGAFTTPISSVMVDAPSIDTSSIPKEGFSILPPPSGPDPRSDPRILKVLSESMKLAP